MWKRYLELPRSVHILCLGTFINRAGTMIIPFLALYLKNQLDLSVEFATQAMGAYGLGAVGAVLVGGHLADAIGRRTIMLAALFGGAAILILFSMVTEPWAIIVCTIAFAFVAEMYRPAASAMIADLVAPEHRPHAYGLMYVAINLGFSVAPVAGGLLARYAFKWLFWADALTAICYGTIILLTIKETLPARGSSEDSEENRRDATSAMDAFKHIVTDRAFMIFCLATLLLGSVYMQSVSTFPLYLGETFGIDAFTYGRIIAVNGCMIAFLQIPFTSLVSRFNRATMICLAAAVTGVGFVLMGVAETAWQFAGAVAIWTCGEMMAAPLAPTVVSDLAPVHLRARYMGVFSVGFSAATMIGVPLGGIVLARFGGGYLWVWAFDVTLVAALLYMSIHRHIEPPESQSVQFV